VDGFSQDGFWHESSFNYHVGVVRDIVATSEVLYHAGFDLYRLDRFRNSFVAPLRLAELGTGVIPGYGDGPNLSIDWFTPNPGGQPADEVFYHRTQDPIVGAALKASSLRGRVSCGPLFVTESWRDAADAADRVPSAVSDHQGLAALRAGDGRDSK
jgi:hypothetical protein